MADEQKRPPGIGGIGEGIRTGMGILSALKETIEETLEDAVKRGDLTPDHARQALRDAAGRIQETFDEARTRLDFVPRREFDELRAELAQLRDRLSSLELEARGGAEGAAPSPGIIITE